jgi:hypothetical protein
MLTDKYTYLLGTLIFAPIWIMLFINRRDLDKKIIFISLVIGLLAILWSPFFWIDYWHPNYLIKFSFLSWQLGGIEDFLYGFFAGGITSAIYEEFFGKKFAKRKNRKHRWILLTIPLFFIFIIGFSTSIFFHFNSLYAALISFSLGSLFIFFYRKDLLKDTLLSGLVFGIITLCFYLIFINIFPGIIQRWWYLEKISGKLFLGIPLEELYWAFGMGALGGPIYEFMMGIKLTKYKK